EPGQGVPDGGRADVEAGGQLLEREPEPRRELEAADLRPQRPIDAVLGRDDLKLWRSLIFDQKIDDGMGPAAGQAGDPRRPGRSCPVPRRLWRTSGGRALARPVTGSGDSLPRG